MQYDNLGYARVSLKHTKYLLHRAVAETFVPNDDPAQKIHVDHIDANPRNNRFDNLQWLTPLENGRKAKRKSSHLWMTVQEVDAAGNIVQSFDSVKQCARTMDVNHQKLRYWLDRGGYPTVSSTIKFVQPPLKRVKRELPPNAKPVPGFRAACTPNGTVYSTWKNLPLLPRMGGHYLQVAVTRDDGTPSLQTVHRLVAMAFHGLPPLDKPQVDHQNAKPTNNQADNLEWVDGSENMRRWADTLDLVKVQLISRKGHVIASYDKVREAAKAQGIPVHCIYNSIRYCSTTNVTWRKTPANNPMHVDPQKEFHHLRRDIILRDSTTQEEISRFQSTRKAAKAIGVDNKTVANRCHKKLTIKGITYIFE